MPESLAEVYLGEELVAPQLCHDVVGVPHRLCVKLGHEIQFLEVNAESVRTIFLLNYHEW